MSHETNSPEYLLEKTSQLWDHSGILVPKSLDQVQAELRLLSTELAISVDILGRIRESLAMLEQSLEEPQ